MAISVSPGLKFEPLPAGGALVFNGASGATSLVNSEALELLNALLSEEMAASDGSVVTSELSAGTYSPDMVASLEKSGLVICS